MVVAVVVDGCIAERNARFSLVTPFMAPTRSYHTLYWLDSLLIPNIVSQQTHAMQPAQQQQSIKHNIRSIVEGRRLLLSISSTKMYYCPQASDYSTHTNDSQMSENIRQENIKIKIK